MRWSLTKIIKTRLQPLLILRLWITALLLLLKFHYKMSLQPMLSYRIIKLCQIAVSLPHSKQKIIMAMILMTKFHPFLLWVVVVSTNSLLTIMLQVILLFYLMLTIRADSQLLQTQIQTNSLISLPRFPCLEEDLIISQTLTLTWIQMKATFQR